MVGLSCAVPERASVPTVSVFVVVSSVFAYINGAGAIPYAMSKAAVEQLGRGLGVELASHGASAMTAYFSLIETDMIRQGVDADPTYWPCSQ